MATPRAITRIPKNDTRFRTVTATSRAGTRSSTGPANIRLSTMRPTQSTDSRCSITRRKPTTMGSGTTIAGVGAAAADADAGAQSSQVQPGSHRASRRAAWLLCGGQSVNRFLIYCQSLEVIYFKFKRTNEKMQSSEYSTSCSSYKYFIIYFVGGRRRTPTVGLFVASEIGG